MRILVIEDEPRIASFLIKGLTRRGYDVVHAINGTDGLALASAGGFDLLLLDLGLPDIDGLDVLRDLRRHGHTLPVIILTAREEDRAAGLKAGADRYLVKPVAFSRLLEHVTAMLPQRS